MYTRILTAVNEYLNSEIAARYAMQLAKATGSKLYLCYIDERGGSEKSLKLAKAAIKRLFHRSEEMGVTAESVFDAGAPAEKIREIVISEKINIVFAATRREDMEKRFYSGTLAKRLSVSLPCSVAIVRVVQMGRLYPKDILVPLKAHMTHLDERAYFAAKLAEAFKSKVTVFHSTSPITRFFHGEIYLSAAEKEKYIPKDVEQFIGHLSKYETIHERKTGHGSAARAITIEAAFRRHDLIIIGASERSLFRSIISGNPLEDVFRETPCNLIIFRPRLIS